MDSSSGHEQLIGLLDEQVNNLPEFISSLGKIIAGRESEFLQLGEKLMVISSQARDFAFKAKSITELVGGDALEQAIISFEHELKCSETYFSLEEKQNTLHELKKALSQINQLEDIIKNFKRIIRNLRLLGISTRIESARLGNKGLGFVTLADDVDTLVQKIELHSKQIVEQIKHLNSVLSNTSTKVNNVLRAESGQVRLLLNTIESDVLKLKSLMQETVSFSSQLESGAHDIELYMGNIVSSMQFHDIARQQIEHVQEALQEVIQTFDSEDDIWDQAVFARDLLQLQHSQMECAGHDFCQAVAELRQSLHEIGGQVKNLDQGLASLNLSRRDGSILQTIGHNMQSIQGLMKEVSSQDRDTAKDMESVGDTVRKVVSFVAGIEEVGVEIELIALNASIKAAHTGEEGRALGVLAVAVQHLSVEARQLTDSIENTLKSVASIATSLCSQGWDEATLISMDASQAIQQDIYNSLSRLQADVELALEQIGSQGQDLEFSLHSLVDEIVMQDEVGGEVDFALQYLDKSERELSLVLPSDMQPSDRLANLLSRYTMHSERQVHGQVMEDESQEGGLDIELFDDLDHDSCEDDLGDNVDLF